MVGLSETGCRAARDWRQLTVSCRQRSCSIKDDEHFQWGKSKQELQFIALLSLNLLFGGSLSFDTSSPSVTFSV